MSPQMRMITRVSRLLSGVAARSGAVEIVVDPLRSLGTARTMASKVLNADNLNPNVLKLEYAVRGPLVIRAAEIEKELQKGAQKPFKKVIRANIGDAHAMGQQPITFIRQVLACVTLPEIIDKGGYPEDVKQRAREILNACGGKSVGAYTMSHGIELIRRHVAEYIERRDGHPANWQDICLSAGASNAIKNVLQLFCNTIDGKPSGVMIPIPQYPLYSASLAEYGLCQCGYYLNEETNWGLDISELERAREECLKRCAVRALVVINPGNPTGQETNWGLDISELERAREECLKRCAVRALVVINPGNPTGQVLTRENIESIIKFAHKHKLFIFADEVYQDNVYAEGSKFFSFKKVLREMGGPYDKEVELASFMSVSKGYAGECGLRGGWMELVNMEPVVQANLYKAISAMLCPTTLGQTTVDCVGYAGECGLRGGWMELVNMEPVVQANLYKAISAMLCPTTLGQTTVDCVAKPPQQGEPSYDLWLKEKTAVLDSLNKRAKMIAETFNKMEGFSCQVVQGAMYAFPQFQLPARAVEAAKKAGKAPDVYYAFKLLEETGICVVPGSGFGQRPGTYHFRTTILPQPALLQEMLDVFQAFHKKFTAEYSK